MSLVSVSCRKTDKVEMGSINFRLSDRYAGTEILYCHEHCFGYNRRKCQTRTDENMREFGKGDWRGQLQSDGCFDSWRVKKNFMPQNWRGSLPGEIDGVSI